MKVFFALGTRPEAIKLAPLIRYCRATPQFDVIVCNTGQHKSLAREMLLAFGIESDIELDIMRRGQTLTEITTSILSSIESPLRDWCPDWVVVQGDTTTSFAVALAAFYQKLPVAHVEAGLRTHDRYSPWPEEINRRLNSVLATAHFAPTNQSRENLISEGVAASQISVTGNTGIDSLFFVSDKLDKDAAFSNQVRSALIDRGLPFLSSPRAAEKSIVVTAHRRENFGAGIEAICRAIVSLAKVRTDLPFIFPVHPNPEVTGPVDRIIRDERCPNIFLVAPLDYFSFTYLLKYARLIISDSGGIQEEAVSLGKKLVILRETTERTELVGQGGVWIVGTEERAIVDAVTQALADKSAGYRSRIFGDGNASARIAQGLLNLR